MKRKGGAGHAILFSSIQKRIKGFPFVVWIVYNHYYWPWLSCHLKVITFHLVIANTQTTTNWAQFLLCPAWLIGDELFCKKQCITRRKCFSMCGLTGVGKHGPPVKCTKEEEMDSICSVKALGCSHVGVGEKLYWKPKNKIQDTVTFFPAPLAYGLYPRDDIYRNNLGTTTATRMKCAFIQHNKVLMAHAKWQ